MALGYQWTKYCSWMLLFANHLELLLSFASQLFVNAVVKLKHLVYNFGCPRLVRLLFCIISLVLPEHVCGVSVI